MCGIVGVIGSKTAITDVLGGLTRLEYRGYDSAGIATLEGERISRRRSVGKISELKNLLTEAPFHDHRDIAIGHTRWATHGAPNEANAHPHATSRVALVHNGIIENYQELKKDLTATGDAFTSDTDTEVITRLIDHHLAQGSSPLDAVRNASKKARGAFAIGALFKGHENILIGTRRSAPLVVGIGADQNYLASDPYALAPYTNQVIFLAEDDIAVLTATGVTLYDGSGSRVSRPVQEVKIDEAVAGKNGYDHFMLKEIYEQPDVVARTLNTYLSADRTSIKLPQMPFNLAAVPQLTIVACGTSWHAAMVAKYWFERYARVPVNVDIASEFRYRNAPLVAGGLTLLISQSGETADTLAALDYAKRQGQHIVSLVNVKQSSIDRASDLSLYTEAGPEIGVASTKAFTTQMTVLALLALATARAKDTLTSADVTDMIKALSDLPTKLRFIADMDDTLAAVAPQISPATSALYLGRDTMFPLALEGALKLKEISYIHAEAYAAGEMKHGPIALIEDKLPIIMLAPHDRLFDKVISNMQEVEARGGHVLLFTDQAGATAAGEADNRTVIICPESHPLLAPFIYSIPMQLLAYHTAVHLKRDVDQPRNLAKSVTVE